MAYTPASLISGVMPIAVFYIYASPMFDIKTGKVTEVLLTTPDENTACLFEGENVQDYLKFVNRMDAARKVYWLAEPRGTKFLIKGVQYR